MPDLSLLNKLQVRLKRHALILLCNLSFLSVTPSLCFQAFCCVFQSLDVGLRGLLGSSSGLFRLILGGQQLNCETLTLCRSLFTASQRFSKWSLGTIRWSQKTSLPENKPDKTHNNHLCIIWLTYDAVKKKKKQESRSWRFLGILLRKSTFEKLRFFKYFCICLEVYSDFLAVLLCDSTF